MAGRQEIATFYAFSEQEMREYAQAKAAAAFVSDVIGHIESLRMDDNPKEVSEIIEIILEYIYYDCGYFGLPTNASDEVQ